MRLWENEQMMTSGSHTFSNAIFSGYFVISLHPLFQREFLMHLAYKACFPNIMACLGSHGV